MSEKRDNKDVVIFHLPDGMKKELQLIVNNINNELGVVTGRDKVTLTDVMNFGVFYFLSYAKVVNTKKIIGEHLNKNLTEYLRDLNKK
jgi:hypothetical protein